MYFPSKLILRLQAIIYGRPRTVKGYVTVMAFTPPARDEVVPLKAVS